MSEIELKRLDDLPAETMGKVDRAAIEMARSELAYRRGMSKEAAAAAGKAIQLAGETSFRLYARGTDANRMREFYATVIKTLAANRGGKLITAWADREKAYREAL